MPDTSKTASENLHAEPIDHLQELFIEVSALAVRLRQEVRRGQIADDLPAGGSNVLGTLARLGPLTVPQIARLNATSRQNIQTIVNRLARERCIELRPNPAHKRSELVHLTDLGQASVEAVGRNEAAYKERLLAHCTKDELERSAKLLRSIREALTAVQSAQPKTDITAQQQRSRLRTPSITFQTTPSEVARPTETQRIKVERPSFEPDELPVNLL